ncbi:hypothetical protein ABVT39_004370 [Epinephelus coioides]
MKRQHCETNENGLAVIFKAHCPSLGQAHLGELSKQQKEDKDKAKTQAPVVTSEQTEAPSVVVTMAPQTPTMPRISTHVQAFQGSGQAAPGITMNAPLPPVHVNPVGLS